MFLFMKSLRVRTASYIFITRIPNIQPCLEEADIHCLKLDLRWKNYFIRYFGIYFIRYFGIIKPRQMYVKFGI